MDINDEKDIFLSLKNMHGEERAKKLATYIAATACGMKAAKCIAEEVFGPDVTPDLVLTIYGRMSEKIQSISDDH